MHHNMSVCLTSFCTPIGWKTPLHGSHHIQLTSSMIIIIPRSCPSQINKFVPLDFCLKISDLTRWKVVRYGSLWDTRGHKWTSWGCSAETHLVAVKIILTNFRSRWIPFYFTCNTLHYITLHYKQLYDYTSLCFVVRLPSSYSRLCLLPHTKLILTIWCKIPNQGIRGKKA